MDKRSAEIYAWYIRLYADIVGNAEIQNRCAPKESD